MRYFIKTFALVFAFVSSLPLLFAQGTAPDPHPASDAVRAVASHDKPVSSAGTTDELSSAGSLADLARQKQQKDLDRVKVSPEEAARILHSVDPLLRFASRDSGFAIKTSVKPRMISRDDLVAIMEARKTDDEDAKRLQSAELSLKKFGFAPRSFSTKKFVQSMYAEQVEGFYDPETKMISLLNWVAPESQLDVLAHELTHALQDQHFNLKKWEHTPVPPPAPDHFQVTAAEAWPESEARRAVVEGQAMVVLLDHQLQQRGIPVTLEHLPGASNSLAEYMATVPVPDTPVIHAAPIFLRDSMAFPYREGLLFEVELLGKGGKELAFNHVFARPPANTHEILHPRAYMTQEKLATPRIPDLSALLADKYEVIDSGGLGELDIRSLIKQYGNSKQAESISPGWRGSSYLMVRRKDVSADQATTADAALIYISAWDSSQTARHFAKFYANAVTSRYHQATPVPENCQGHDCPLESFRFNTEEGLVTIECRSNNLVIVTESFESGLANSLVAETLKANASGSPAPAKTDLSLRYISAPVFADLRVYWEAVAIAAAAKLGQ